MKRAISTIFTLALAFVCVTYVASSSHAEESDKPVVKSVQPGQTGGNPAGSSKPGAKVTPTGNFGSGQQPGAAGKPTPSGLNGSPEVEKIEGKQPLTLLEKAILARQKGTPMAQLVNDGYSAALLKEAGFTIRELAEEFRATELKELGFTTKELFLEVFVDEFFVEYLGSISISDYWATSRHDYLGFLHSFILTGQNEYDFNFFFTATELKDIGFPAWFLSRVRFSAVEIKDAGFTLAQMKDVGYSAPYMERIGFTLAQLKNAGYTLTQLKGAGFTATQLQKAGFTFDELMQVFTLAELHAVGISGMEVGEGAKPLVWPKDHPAVGGPITPAGTAGTPHTPDGDIPGIPDYVDQNTNNNSATQSTGPGACDPSQGTCP